MGAYRVPPFPGLVLQRVSRDDGAHRALGECCRARARTMLTDTLSDVLRAVRLHGAIFFAVDGRAPWVAESPAARVIAPHLLPGVEHVIEYHMVTRGSCWAGLTDQPAVRLETGDVIVFPRGDAHVLSSAPGMRGEVEETAFHSASHRPLPITLSLQGDGQERTGVICGFFGCDARPFNPLLNTLPAVIHLRGSGDGHSVLRTLVELAVDESSSAKPGGQVMLARICELLFVEMVRRYLTTLPPEEVGWFAALRDPTVGRALQKLHERPAHNWSLDGLAREVGVSRTLLAERFAHIVGIPPIQYLAQWRMQLAASLLRTSTASLAQIADGVGYGSEAALSRAFKRYVGIAPAPYRRDKHRPL